MTSVRNISNTVKTSLHVKYVHKMKVVNSLEFRGNYNATSNNMQLVH